MLSEGEKTMAADIGSGYPGRVRRLWIWHGRYDWSSRFMEPWLAWRSSRMRTRLRQGERAQGTRVGVQSEKNLPWW